MSPSLPQRPALLVIDMQHGLYHASTPPWQRERVLANIQQAIALARTAGVPVFAARHTGPAGSPLAPGSAPSQLLPELGIDATVDFVFDKTRPSCFAATGLHDALQARGITALVVAGMKTEFCVDTTCRAASALGYEVTLVQDAHTTTETDVLPAASIIAHHNQTLGGAFVQRVDTLALPSVFGCR